MYDSFYSNNESFTGVTSVDSLTTDLYFHYTDEFGSQWKLSGNTAATASTPILEDSDTTAITVTPATLISYTGETQQLAVVNQDSANVISECTFTRSNSGASVSEAGLITILLTGSTIITVTHNDGPTGTTTVTAYWPGPLDLDPSTNNSPPDVVTGITGTTLQLTLTTDNTSQDVTDAATWTSVISGTSTASTGVTVDSSGLITIDNDAEDGLVVTITGVYVTGASSTYAPATNLTVVGP